MAEGEAQFVSPDEFMAGLQAMGFNVTQEEALTLASVLETDAEGNINLASLQQPGSPIMEQLAAMQGGFAPEAAEEPRGRGASLDDTLGEAPEIPQSEAALVALSALEAGDQEGLAAALAEMAPEEAEALQAVLSGAAPSNP